jgi:hypothetical protein
MAVLKVKITGVKPLLMHNERLADPLDSYTLALAEVSKKRTKTQDDHRELSWREFEGSLYCDDKIGPYLPDTWIRASIISGAKKEKMGKTFTAGIVILDQKNPLIYKGPRTPRELYDGKFYDRRCVGVNNSKTARTRPCFREWSCEFTLMFEETLIDRANIDRALARAGQLEGIGDYRPVFGLYEATINGK